MSLSGDCKRETEREMESENVIKMKLQIPREPGALSVVINLYFNFQIIINLGEMSCVPTRKIHYKVLQTQHTGT